MIGHTRNIGTIRRNVGRVLAAALVWCTVPLRAEEPPAAAPTSQPVRYRRPAHPAGSALASSGGIRHGTDLPVVSVLVADHDGVTSEDQPTLYWYQSARPAKGVKAVLTIVKVRAGGNVEPDPLLEAAVNSQQEGICKFDLSAAKDAEGNPVKLEVGKDYRWSIALVPNQNARSQDSVDSAFIHRVPPPASGKEDKDPYGKAAAAAEAGRWYDALEALSRSIEQSPADSSLRLARAAFLEAAGKGPNPLPEMFNGLERAAALDRAAAGRH